MLLKQHVLLTCQRTHVNLIHKLYEISYKPVYRKFMSLQNNERLRSISYSTGLGYATWIRFGCGKKKLQETFYLFWMLIVRLLRFGIVGGNGGIE
jgi:hypothetical protein